MQEITNYLPKWTKKVVTEGGGRDPLGLSRVAFILTDYLLNGIITTTERARYYSFYTWALWHIEREENPQNYEHFVEAFRRREAAMALSTLATKPELSPVGVEQVRNQLERGAQSGEFDCNFKVLPSNNMGGYGQYYSGSIYQLKLTNRDEKGIDRVACHQGTEIAEAFDQSIRNTNYVKSKKYLESTISIRDLKELQKCFTLDSIKSKFAIQERAELTEIFFSQNENYRDDHSVLRRQTLTILLHLISEYGKHDCFPVLWAIDESLLFAIYYDVLWVSEEELVRFKKLKEHDPCYDLWKQFCLHQFITQALEYLLFAVIEAVGHESAGLSLDDTVGILTQPTFFEALKEITSLDCSKPIDLLSVFGISKIPDKDFSRGAQELYSPNHSLGEAKILDALDFSPQEAAAKTVVLLAVLFAKWRGVFGETTMSFVANKAGQQVWAGQVLPYVDEWLNPEKTWPEILSKLIENLVLNQHDRIMYEKRRLDSCWLHRANGKIMKDQDYRPIWRASRFLNAARIMADLNLLEIDESKQVLITSEGKKLVNELTK